MSKRKEDQPETNDGADEAEPPAKKSRGRPRIHPPKDPNTPKRPRGRPPKKEEGASGDKPAPAKAKAKQGKVAIRKSPAGKKGRGRPKGSGGGKKRGRPSKAAAAQAEEEPSAEDAGDAEESS